MSSCIIALGVESMKKPRIAFRGQASRLFNSVIVAIGCLLSTAVYAGNFEAEEINLSAKNILGADALQGEHYRITEAVINKGFMNHYAVESDFGKFEADSDQQLAKLIVELGAISELQALQKTEVFSKAAMETLKRPVDMVKKIADKPVETIKGVPKGVGRLFKRTARQISDASKQAKEFADERKQKKERQEAGEGEDDAMTTEEVVEKGTEVGKTLGENYLGQDKSIRALAKQLAVDPYSSNKVLQKEMADVAWVMTAGSFGAGQFVPSLPSEIRSLNDINQMVWDTHPVDLKLRNEGSLRKMGISDIAINNFFENKEFTPSTQTAIVSSLEKLENAAGREVFIQGATKVENSAEASSFAQIAVAFAEYQLSHEKAAAIVASPIWPLLKTVKGNYVFMAPVDYLSWTENVSAGASRLIKRLRDSSANSQFELRVKGEVSKLARTKLESLGWVVYEKGMI